MGGWYGQLVGSKLFRFAKKNADFSVVFRIKYALSTSLLSIFYTTACLDGGCISFRTTKGDKFLLSRYWDLENHKNNEVVKIRKKWHY